MEWKNTNCFQITKGQLFIILDFLFAHHSKQPLSVSLHCCISSLVSGLDSNNISYLITPFAVLTFLVGKLIYVDSSQCNINSKLHIMILIFMIYSFEG